MKTIHFLVNAAMPSVDASLLLHWLLRCKTDKEYGARRVAASRTRNDGMKMKTEYLRISIALLSQYYRREWGEKKRCTPGRNRSKSFDCWAGRCHVFAQLPRRRKTKENVPRVATTIEPPTSGTIIAMTAISHRVSFVFVSVTAAGYRHSSKYSSVCFLLLSVNSNSEKIIFN